MVEYLFDYSGNWIAFKIGKFLYNEDGDWIGWFPYEEKIAVDTDGEYLGTIYKNDRLFPLPTVHSFCCMLPNLYVKETTLYAQRMPSSV